MLLGLIHLLFESAFLISYVSGPNSFPAPLSREEEALCLKNYKNGDADAKNMLIEHNLRLVAHIAKKYHGCGVDCDDLVSIGTIGLIKGITTYDIEKKVRLATYAARCIENAIPAWGKRRIPRQNPGALKYLYRGLLNDYSGRKACVSRALRAFAEGKKKSCGQHNLPHAC